MPVVPPCQGTVLAVPKNVREVCRAPLAGCPSFGGPRRPAIPRLHRRFRGPKGILGTHLEPSRLPIYTFRQGALIQKEQSLSASLPTFKAELLRL